MRVNAEFADELQKKEGKLKKKADKAKRAGLAADEPVLDDLEEVEGGQGAGGLLNDSRFSQLFDDADFKIDNTAEEYLAHHNHMRGATAAASCSRPKRTWWSSAERGSLERSLRARPAADPASWTRLSTAVAVASAVASSSEAGT